MAAQDSKSILSAWFFAVGLTAYRGWAHRVDQNGKPVKAPPSPGEMLKTVGLFGILALVNEMVSDEKAHHALALIGWGVDIAALINLVGGNPKAIQGGAWPPPTAPNFVVLPGQGSTGESSNGGQSGGSGSSSGGSSQPSSPPWWLNVPGAAAVGKVFSAIGL
jgi:hypothetical protein